MKKVCAYAPASVGNFSLGFDLLGAALAPINGSKLGDEVEVTPSETYSLTVTGRFASKLPQDTSQNIVTRCYDFFNQALTAKRLSPQTLALTLRKNLPIGSGLGSSAASIVAAFHALNYFYNSPFEQDELLEMMGQLEGQISGSIHYDNVAPCFIGGMTLMTGQQPIALPLPVIEQWRIVVCYSGISVSTAQARQLLPEHFAMQDVLTFGRQLAVFVHALHCGDAQLATSMVNDVIAEPHRKVLLPGYDMVARQSIDAGASAFGISGSGPTVFALCDNDDIAGNVAEILTQQYIQNDDGFTHVCKIDVNGAIATENKR